MSFSESLVLVFSFIISIVFYKGWYSRATNIWPQDRIGFVKQIFMILPFLSLGIIFFTLKVLASFDVIRDFLYIIFYIVFGLSWVAVGMYGLAMLFDISYADDLINMNNKAALMPVVSAFLGSTIIYSGANIGDGPGWYCVFVAGAMGMVSWFFLGWIINILSGTFEKITVERNINTGILFGFYLFASAIILARASAGDWTSFYDTILEFGAGYPVLFLAAFHIILEKMINRNNDPYYNNENSDKIRLYPILIGIFYIVYAVIAVLLSLPMKENPIYEQIMLLF